MKDFCQSEQVFFNTTDRIKFLKQRTNNQFTYYKRALNSYQKIMG